MARSHRVAATPLRWLRIILLTLFVLLGIAAVLLAILLIPVIPNPTLHYADRKGHQQTNQWQEQDSIYTELTLVSSSGLKVDLSTRIPKATTSPRSLVLLLGGRRTGRNAVKLVSNTRGIALAAISYPFEGDPNANRLELLADLPDMQQAIKDTTPAIMLAMDYLLTQPSIDPKRIELAGVSLGGVSRQCPRRVGSTFPSCLVDPWCR
jgi:hypothetical protein